MIRGVFGWLSISLTATPFLAIIASFLWGILSIILSPCHLASIPLVIGFIGEQGKISTGKAFKLSFLFALGILVTIAAIGVITAAMGRIMGNIGVWGNYLVALLFFVIGLYLLDILKLSWGDNQILGLVRKKGYIAALLMGLLFGLALGPCTFAYLAPILGVVFRISSNNIIWAMSLFIAFGLGHCLVIVCAGTAAEKVQQYLNWSEHTKTAIVMRKICGVFVILGAIYLIHATFK